MFSGIAIGVGLGGAVGALSAYLGWNSSGEPFESKKFIGGLVNGIIAGVTLVAMSFEALKGAITNDPTGVQFLELMILTSLGILGSDFARTKISGMIANRSPEPAATPS